jgi:hypothetical protein
MGTMCPYASAFVFGVRNAHAAFRISLFAFHSLCAASISDKEAEV